MMMTKKILIFIITVSIIACKKKTATTTVSNSSNTNTSYQKTVGVSWASTSLPTNAVSVSQGTCYINGVIASPTSSTTTSSMIEYGYNNINTGDVVKVLTSDSLLIQIIESSYDFHGSVINGHIQSTSTNPWGTDEVLINTGTSLTFTVH